MKLRLLPNLLLALFCETHLLAAVTICTPSASRSFLRITTRITVTVKTHITVFTQNFMLHFADETVEQLRKVGAVLFVFSSLLVAHVLKVERWSLWGCFSLFSRTPSPRRSAAPIRSMPHRLPFCGAPVLFFWVESSGASLALSDHTNILLSSRRRLSSRWSAFASFEFICDESRLEGGH